MAKAKVRHIRTGLNDELTRYLARFDDNDEIDFGSKSHLKTNWERIRTLQAVSGLNENSKNLRGRFVSWLSSNKFLENKTESLLSILHTLDTLRLDSRRYNLVVDALTTFNVDGTEALNECIELMHRHKIPLSKHNNLSNLMTKTPAQLGLIASIMTKLSDLKLTNERFNTIVNNIHLLNQPLEEDVRDALIACLERMHQARILLTAGDNFQKIMEKPLLYKPLLEAMEPLTRQRFEMLKQLDTGLVLAEKGEFLAGIIPYLNKHALPLSSNVPQLTELTGLEISKLAGLLNYVDAGYVNQKRFNALLTNAASLVMEDENDNTKVNAVGRYMTSMARTGLPITAELGSMMGRPVNEIQGINALVDAFNNRANRFFNKSGLTANKYDLICERAASHLVDENNRIAILANIKHVSKAGALSDFQLTSLIENNPVETNTLLRFLKTRHGNEAKPLTKARLKVVTDFAEYLNADKMTALTNSIALLEDNKIPLTKYDNLARLMQLDTDHLEQVRTILTAMNKLSPERVSIVLDNLSSPSLDNAGQLAQTIKILEAKHIALGKHDCLKTLMSMDSYSLEKFNLVLEALDDAVAPEAAYEAIIKKLPYLKNNPEKMPLMVDVINNMALEGIPFVSNFLDRLSGQKDSISQLAKLSEASLSRLRDPKQETFKANISNLKRFDRQIKDEIGGNSIIEMKDLSHDNIDPDEDDLQDDSPITPSRT